MASIYESNEPFIDMGTVFCGGVYLRQLLLVFLHMLCISPSTSISRCDSEEVITNISIY